MYERIIYTYIRTYIHICVYITVPPCYVTTNCLGEPINGFISFSECCANFGVSYELGRQCLPCPSTSKLICYAMYMYLFNLCYTLHKITLISITYVCTVIYITFKGVRIYFLCFLISDIHVRT